MRDQRSEIRNGKSETVATILDTDNVEWSPNPSSLISHPSAITPGEPLAISSGLVELQLKQGATLLIEGPAEWSIDGNNRATLKQGKLVATVPRQAIGFTLDTPTAKIVDLGTEFGVEVDSTSETQVQVIRGVVEASLRNTRGPTQRDAKPLRVEAGSAVRISRGEANVTRMRADPQRFATLLSASVGKKHAAEGASTVSIPLGNLFDDPQGTPLDQAIASDEFGATAEIDDLGVDRALYGGNPIRQISEGVAFDFSPLGWQDQHFGLVANDRWTGQPSEGRPLPQPEVKPGISTRGSLAIAHTSKLEDGIGLHANALITFDLDEIRTAANCLGQPLRFVCDRAGINDDVHGEAASASHLVVLVTTADELIFAQVDGESCRIEVQDGVWRLKDPPPPPLMANGHFLSLDYRLPAAARTLTLAAAEAGQFNADHVVWSGARLEVVGDSDESP